MKQGLLEVKYIRRNSTDFVFHASVSKVLFNVGFSFLESTLIVRPAKVVGNHVLAFTALAASNHDTASICNRERSSELQNRAITIEILCR
jgi:hypothetical protein